MKQTSRWSETQLATLKGALADNEIAITGIRKVLLEDELTPNEKTALKLAIQNNEPMQELVRRHYCPSLKVDAPIGQVQDRLITIQVDTLSPEIATLQAAATELSEECMKAHIEELITGTVAASFKSLYKLDLDDPAKTYIGLLARNKYLIDAERLTHHLALLSGRVDETPSQTEERLKKDSSK